MNPNTIPTLEAAKRLGISHASLKAAILSGTMPVGTVFRKPGSTQDTVVVIRERFEKWIRGEDMKEAT
jgi:NOL1/NOP2/fmu family ribosome biogenesis protein